MIRKPARLYRPSNGTEGCAFHAAWCEQCQRDKAMREGADFDDCDDNEVCKIIADTMAYNKNDPKYPQEWIYGADGYPRCTAFVPAGTEIRERCEHTLDMFK